MVGNEDLVNIGLDNVKRWNYLKIKFNLSNNWEFVYFLLDLAERTLSSTCSIDNINVNNKTDNSSNGIDEKTNCDNLLNSQSNVNIENDNETPLKLSCKNSKVEKFQCVPQDKQSLLCSICDKLHSSKCVSFDTFTSRDEIELPENFHYDTIDTKHGLSVFTGVAIDKYTWFGPIKGNVVLEKEIMDDACMKHVWEVSAGSFIETKDKESSNWLRYIRPAPSRSLRNMTTVSVKGCLYFVTICQIVPGQELMYWSDPTGAWASKNMDKTNCGGCNVQFEHSMYYRLHCIVFHEASLSLTVRKYHCKVCSAPVLGKQNIIKHAALLHNGKGAYQCQYCSKFFLKLNYLEMHKNYGCSANPHRTRPLCDYCGRKFSQPQKLKMHIKRMHSDLAEVLKEFQCRKCLKVLGSRATLQRHIKEVHESPSLSCAICKKAFTNKSNLKIHMLTHSGVKPFKCVENECEAAFTTKQCLQFHYKKAHGLNEKQIPRIHRSIEYTYSAYSGRSKDHHKTDKEIELTEQNEAVSQQSETVRNSKTICENNIIFVNETSSDMNDCGDIDSELDVTGDCDRFDQDQINSQNINSGETPSIDFRNQNISPNSQLPYIDPQFHLRNAEFRTIQITETYPSLNDTSMDNYRNDITYSNPFFENPHNLSKEKVSEFQPYRYDCHSLEPIIVDLSYNSEFNRTNNKIYQPSSPSYLSQKSPNNFNHFS